MTTIEIKAVLPEGRRALRISDAAKTYGVCRSTLYELAKDGKLKICKLGGRSLIRVEDIEALLAQGASA